MLQRATVTARRFEVNLRAVWLAAFLVWQVAAADAPSFDVDRYLAHIQYLASPELKGRESGSPELEKAAKYIEEQFRGDGLRPIGGGYLQAFPVTTSSRPGRNNRLESVLHGETETLQTDKDFTPYSFSSSGKASGSVVFAGYGITAPEYGYDDYAGLDVRGKFVLVLAHEPQEFDPASVFEGKVYTDHSQGYSKAANARNHGARGLLLVLDRVNHPDSQDALEAFINTTGPPDAGILFVQVRESVAEGWFQASGKDLGATEEAINSDLRPRSFALADVTVRESVDVERVVKTVHNVVGYLPGSGEEYIVVGAHYDHLGLGGPFSLAPTLQGMMHPGADDNASGTAGVLELARYFSGLPKQRRGILFIAFAGEELGLLGSGYYANHPLLPLANAVAMLNMDMIGRVRDDKLFIGGASTGTSFRADLDALVKEAGFRVDYSESGYGSSDHTSFTAKQVPTLFFFSGLHGDYHRPSDTWDKIDAPDAIRVVRLVAGMIEKLESANGRPEFVRVTEAEPHGSGNGSGYGPNFGSVPDFAEPPTGVRFADVHPDSPAGLAGLKPGDILVRFDNAEIRNLYDFTYALRAHKAGDEVVVDVLRGNQRISARVRLAERK